MPAEVEPPVFHIHVKVVSAMQDSRGIWYALFYEPDGNLTWMEQGKSRPEIGSEQVLYILRKDSSEHAALGRLVDKKASQKTVQRFIERAAKKYGEWCTRTWEEARKEAH